MENPTSESQISVGPAPDATSVGAALAAARSAKGWAVEDIARMLKLSAVQVNGLESGDHSRLPSAVFVRGFIRSYARLVNLELAPFVPSVSSTSVKAAAAETADRDLMHRRRGVVIEPNPYRRVPAIVMGIACVLLGLAYYEFVMNAPPGSAPVAAAQSKPGQDTPPEALDTALEPRDTRESSASMPASLATAAPLILKKSSQPFTEDSGINGRDGLHFVFNGNSWVEVRDRAGRVVYSKSNPSGTESLVRGDPPLSVVVGAASVVKLSYNGSPVDLAMHATADVARLRLE